MIKRADFDLILPLFILSYGIILFVLQYNSVKKHEKWRQDMFIYSFRAATLKFLGIISVTLVALIAIVAFVPVYAEGNGTVNTSVDADGAVDYSYDKVKSAGDAVNFLSQFGWTVNGETGECQKVTIPHEFDKVFAAYNEIQKAQGLDLSKYKKRELTRYTFEVTNYDDYDGKVYANVLVYRNRVVGGDICSADVSGFVHGFEKGAEQRSQ